MDEKKLERLLRAIDRATTAATNLVGTTQLVDDSQTITGTTMALAHTPTFVFGVYLNGQRLTKTTDYSITTVTVTFVQTLATDLVTVVYEW